MRKEFLLVEQVCGGGTVNYSSDQLFGIEVEVERAYDVLDRISSGDLALPRAWGTERDGSLRNGGLEFISRALPLPAMEEAVHTLYNMLSRAEWESTMRCGIHIHADMRDLRLNQLAGVYMAYALVEPLLFRFCGADREENIYCVPWYRAVEEAEVVAQHVHSPAGSMTINQCCKYSALYAGPLGRFGTIEFRHAPTWTAAQPLITWLNIVAQIVSFGRSCDPSEVYLHFLDDEEGALRSILAEHYDTLVRGPEDLALLYDCDVPGVGQLFLPKLDTYKVNWALPSLYVDGPHPEGYAHGLARARLRTGAAPMYAGDDYPEDFDPEVEEEGQY